MNLLAIHGPQAFGPWQVTRIVDWEGEAFPHTILFPGVPLEELRRASPPEANARLSPEGAVIISNQIVLLQSKEGTVLAEQGSGNGKNRPNEPHWDHQFLPYLQTLASLGVKPEDVDAVFLSHLHPDHVGLATTDRGGRWEPTFPRAEYVLHPREWEYWQPLYMADPGGHPWIGDSVLPLVESGCVRWANAGDRIRGLRVHEAFGHTPGHCLFEADGVNLWLLGDLFHHPAQIVRPEWPSGNFDSHPEVNRRIRIDAYRRFAETGATLIAAHLGGPFRIAAGTDGGYLYQSA